MSYQDRIQAGLKKRHRKEAIFKNAGIFAIGLSLCFLIILFTAIISKGYASFTTHQIALEVDLKKEYFSDAEINHRLIVKDALINHFPEVKDQDIHIKFALYELVSKISRKELKDFIEKHPETIGTKQLIWFTASSKVDIFLRETKNSTNFNAEDFNLTLEQVGWIKNLQENHKIRSGFNWLFFQNADSREPEIAGIGASVVGSFFTIIVFLLCSFPVGVLAGFYLEEFAPKNIWTDIVEVTINNLAAIPSIIYGLLGLILYLNFFHLPRSSALVGGLTLALMVLPIIIISTRNAINTVPGYIKDAATALGASKVQTMLHHIFPLSLPGIMTGTILAISRALGETAPLLMIGMVAFVADVPSSLSDPTSALPVQVYLWSDSPEPGFATKTAGAIMILLAVLILFNSLAVYLRKKFERKW